MIDVVARASHDNVHDLLTKRIAYPEGSQGASCARSRIAGDIEQSEIAHSGRLAAGRAKEPLVRRSLWGIAGEEVHLVRVRPDATLTGVFPAAVPGERPEFRQPILLGLLVLQFGSESFADGSQRRIDVA
jgi:hypothetical protein